jgi:hypothetical protein
MKLDLDCRFNINIVLMLNFLCMFCTRSAILRSKKTRMKFSPTFQKKKYLYIMYTMCIQLCLFTSAMHT